MNCQKCQTEFDDRLDGRLDPARAQAFAAHTASCPACRTDWQAYQALWEVVGRQPSAAPSFGFAQRTLRRLHEQPAPRFWQLPAFHWSTAVSVLAIVSLTSVLTCRQMETSRRVSAYAAAQHDQLADFDVIVALDLLEGKTEL